jgi:hypothetical protein
MARFYDGVPTYCAECHAMRVRENRLANVEYYRAYDAVRFQCNPKRREKQRAYDKTPNGKAAMAKARKKWLASNQEKRAAHILLGNALRNGGIVKPKNCTMCGKGGRIHGHHDDYAKPFEVIWCCAECHGHIHAKHKFAKAT